MLFAVLFGSRHAGRVRPDSDWDVGIYLDERLAARLSKLDLSAYQTPGMTAVPFRR